MTILNFVIGVWTSAGGRNIYGSWAGGDYSCFYIAGKILNEHSPSKLYDFSLHSELLHTLLPNISPTEELPYLNPPFFALIFKPLSRLPFMASYFVWSSISLILYVFAFKLFWKSLDSMPPETSNISLLFVLSFEPFIIENILGGNSSSVGFFAFALFLYFGHFKKDFLSGLSLGILIYKPTFLIVILPMLLVARKTKTLFGFSICSITLIFLSMLTAGYETCIEYVRFLVGASSSTLASETIYRTWKYVDILSFSRLLFGTISPIILVLIVVPSLVIIMQSIKYWWKINDLGTNSQELLKASVITFTCIINLHFAIYDTVILVLSVFLTVNVLYRNAKDKNSTDLPPLFEFLLVSIYVTPWISQSVARSSGLQIVTLFIAIIGSYQLLHAGRQRQCRLSTKELISDPAR